MGSGVRVAPLSFANMITLQAQTIEVAGLVAAVKAVRLPHNGKPLSRAEAFSRYFSDKKAFYSEQKIFFDQKDIDLMKILEKKGDQHAKVLRGIQAWVLVSAPLYWWSELETYEVGRTRLSSTSTMHTEGKGLSGEELQKVKMDIPSGRILTKMDCFSYQTLRRIVFQRHNHRLPEWAQFIDWIKTLPLADELILHGLEGLENGDEV